MSNKQVMALALATLLAGCGGGETAQQQVTPQAATQALRARALAVSTTAIDPAEAARQLFDWAETHYPEYFPVHEVTQTYSPFLYRYYASTGIYLAVAVGGNATYPDGVWAKGGEFGNAPLFVGPITKFITPIDPNGGPTGANNGCFDLSYTDVAGSRIVIDYSYSGGITGSETVDTLVGNLTTFEGYQAREVSAKTKGTHTETKTGLSVAVDTENKFYLKRTGDAETTQYGGVLTANSTQAGFNLTTTSRMVWTPPWVDKQYGLAIGGSYTYTQTGTVTMTTGGIPGLPGGTPTTTPVSSTQTVKYVGRESVTVPAGTYNACKFESKTAGSTDLSTQWVVVGKGVPVKTATTDAAGKLTQTISATAVSLNGQKL